MALTYVCFKKEIKMEKSNQKTSYRQVEEHPIDR